MARMKGENLTFGEHLEDLRRVVIRIGVTLAFGLAISAIFQNTVYELVLAPLRSDAVKEIFQNGDILYLNFHQVQDAFTFQFDILLFSALVITSPLILFWIWEFISPALTRKESWFGGILLTSAVILGLVASWYVYKLVLPFSLRFFLTLNKNPALDNTQFSITALGYLDYFKTLFTATLVIFQIPLIVFCLTRFHLLPVSFFKQNRKYIYFIMMLLMFALIPGDISISILLVLPMFLFFEIAFFLGRVGKRKHQITGTSV